MDILDDYRVSDLTTLCIASAVQESSKWNTLVQGYEPKVVEEMVEDSLFEIQIVRVRLRERLRDLKRLRHAAEDAVRAHRREERRRARDDEPLFDVNEESNPPPSRSTPSPPPN